MDKYTDNNYYFQETEDIGSSYERTSVETELRKTIQRQKKTMFRLMEKINRLRIACIVLILLLIIESFLWWGNSGNDSAVINNPDDTVIVDGTTDNTTVQEQDTSGTNNPDDARVDSIITTMTLEQKVYQMIFTTPENLTGVPEVTMAGDSTRTAIEEYPVGGLIYSKKNLETRQQVKDMLSKIQSYTNIGLFLAIEENGDDSPISSAADVSSISIPSAKDIASGDKDMADKAYSTIAAEMLELGFNLNLAPFAEATEASSDYFSSDIAVASEMVKSSVEAMGKYNLASTLKYFPTNTNTEKTLENMKDSEFAPFKSGIAAGADFVIVSGKSFGTEIFSMSSSVMTDALKGELSFGGVVVADDITASQISDKYTQEQAAVKAINSGADMLICPVGVSKTVNAILSAIESGEISETTINESVKRIIRVKIKRGIQK